GHCIPIDPNYLSYNVKSRLGYPFRFVELAQEVNSSMPAYVVRRVQDLLNDDAKAVRGATVLLLGVTYKPNISDRRESPAIPLAEALLDHGADLTYHDPNIDEWTVAGTPVPRVDDALAAASAADVVVVVQNHREYDIDALARASQRFLDTKGKVTADGAQRL
ncbi:MAG TPA: UDP binding domain-containing protein, partial [Brevibacterium sp.]|nr:UDP binding domain-containing protein [Brevibacterium sp.]